MMTPNMKMVQALELESLLRVTIPAIVLEGTPYYECLTLWEGKAYYGVAGGDSEYCLIAFPGFDTDSMACEQDAAKAREGWLQALYPLTDLLGLVGPLRPEWNENDDVEAVRVRFQEACAKRLKEILL